MLQAGVKVVKPAINSLETSTIPQRLTLRVCAAVGGSAAGVG